MSKMIWFTFQIWRNRYETFLIRFLDHHALYQINFSCKIKVFIALYWHSIERSLNIGCMSNFWACLTLVYCTLFYAVGQAWALVLILLILIFKNFWVSRETGLYNSCVRVSSRQFPSSQKLRWNFRKSLSPISFHRHYSTK